MPQVKLQGFVGINSDDEYQLVPQPMVTIGENIELDSSTSNQGMSCKPRKGDKYVFPLGDVGVSSKKYRISNDVDNLFIRITSSNKQIVYFEAVGFNLLSLHQALQIEFANLSDLGFFSQYTPTSPVGPYITIGINLSLAGNINNVNYHNDFKVESGNESGVKIECIEESVAPSMTGPLRPIGSSDYRGDTFIFSAVSNLPPVIREAVSTSFNFGQNKWQITLGSHGLQNTDFIILSGAPPEYSFLNGVHNVEVVDNNRFTLVGVLTVPSNPVTLTSIIITKNIRSVGEIGVLRKDFDGNELYTRLIRSSELNFLTTKQIDVDIEENLGSIACYFTDFNNSQRVFYYKGEYITDGALSFNSPDGLYSYDNVDSQMRLIVSTASLQIKFKQQLQNQGSLRSGNKRYFVRGVGSDLSEYSWSTGTGPIPVFQAELTGTPRLVAGDIPDTQCNKSNVLEITGIDPDVVSYIDIAIAEYLEDGFEAYIIKRISVNGRRSVEYTHTGLETALIDLPAAALNIDNRPPSKCLNIGIADNRLILSNIKFRTEKSFDKIFESVKYRIVQRRMPKTGRMYPNATRYDVPDPIDDYMKAGEYQLPENVCYFGTLMPNETYLYAGRLVFKDGFESMPIPFAEIKIDDSPTSADGRRVGGLPTYDTIGGRQGFSVPAEEEGYVNVTGVEFFDFDFNFFIDGLPAFQVLERIDIMRAEVTQPSVLYSGLGILCEKSGTQDVNGQTYDRVEPSMKSFFPPQPPNVSTNFPWKDHAYTLVPVADRRTDVIALYSPDLVFNDSDALLFDTDKVIVYGSHNYNSYPDYIYSNVPAAFTSLGDPDSAKGGYLYFGGDCGWDGGGYTPVEYNIVEAHNVASGAFTIFDNTPIVFTNLALTDNLKSKWLKNVVLKLDQSLQTEFNFTRDYENGSGDTVETRDRGLRYVQIYREIPNKYADLDNVSFLHTGYSIRSTDTSVAVYGGDVFIQKVTMKFSVMTDTTSKNFSAVDFYCHTRVNTQMRVASNIEEEGQSWPAGYGQLVEKWRLSPLFDLTFSSRIYNFRWEVQQKLPYYEGISLVEADPTGIVYSDIKIRNAPIDSYRKFSIADYTSLDTKYGPIYFHGLFNGELFTIQERGLQRQFFNARGVLTTGDGLTALIGDGKAFSRPGSFISQLGTMHKQSVIIGRTAGGNQVLYYYDAVNRHIVRFGSDGTVPISKRAKVSTLIKNNTNLARWSLTPADCFGVHGVWDESYQEAVWTFRLAKNYKGVWQVGIDIKQGDVYSYPGVYYQESFEEIPVLYVAQFDHSAKPGTSMLEDPSRWVAVEYGDESYMNFFSIVWSEKDDRFISKDNIYPTIYIRNNDDVYYPRAKNPVSDIYKRNAGIPLVFYDKGDGKGGKEVLAAVESVFNIDGNLQKKAVALRVLSALSPYLIEVNTNTNKTFILREDFVGRMDQWDAPINKDTQDIELRKFGEGGIFGTFVRVKFVFNTKEEQRLINMVLKFKPVSRLYTT